MSLIRVGLSETKDYADGYDAIFKKAPAPPAADAAQEQGANPAGEGTAEGNPDARAEVAGR